MLIIVEGVDGSGKTTLIEELSSLMPDNTRILRSGPPSTHALDEYVTRLIQYHQIPEMNTIADRWHIGETIYGPLYRGRSSLTPTMRTWVDMFLESRGALKILMNTPFAVVENRLDTRGEDFLQPQHRRLVWDLYHELPADWQRIGPSWRGSDTPEVLVANALKRQEAYSSLRSFKSYIGPSQPSAILLDDGRTAGKVGRTTFESALPPYEDSPAHYLLAAIDAANVKNGFGIANVATEDLGRLLDTLGRRNEDGEMIHPKLVCLGKEAAHEAIGQGILPSASLVHPRDLYSLNKRTTFYAYGARLKELIDGA